MTSSCAMTVNPCPSRYYYKDRKFTYLNTNYVCGYDWEYTSGKFIIYFFLKSGYNVMRNKNASNWIVVRLFFFLSFYFERKNGKILLIL